MSKHKRLEDVLDKALAATNDEITITMTATEYLALIDRFDKREAALIRALDHNHKCDRCPICVAVSTEALEANRKARGDK